MYQIWTGPQASRLHYGPQAAHTHDFAVRDKYIEPLPGRPYLGNQKRRQLMTRRYDLDWLRVIAFSILILFHTGMMFNTWDWHIKNNQTTESMEDVMAFIGQWRMPLLFFISGAAVWFALGRYPARKFARERVQRLLVPLIFGMFVIVPPQVYLERVFRGVSFHSYWGFYATVVEFHPYPQGNFSWHHLWYIPYIFVFSFLALPLFLYLKTPRGRNAITRILEWIKRHNALLLLGIPLAVSEISLRPFWQANANNLVADWAQFSTTLLLFITGYVLASYDPIWEAIERYRFRALGFGLLTMSAVMLFWIADQELAPFPRALYRFCRSMNIWCWVLCLLGFGKKHLSRNHPFLKYANEAVYPFYIVHQTITIMIGFPLIPLPWSIGAKFAIVCSGTFFLSWLVYEGIRRMNWTRVLFGLKARRRFDSQLAQKRAFAEV